LKNRSKRIEGYRQQNNWARKKLLYGITKEEYDAAWEAQGRACAICRGASGDQKRAPGVDHSHVTGAFRGILCGKCNAALGLFGDDPDRLRAAAQYLDDTGRRTERDDTKWPTLDTTRPTKSSGKAKRASSG